MFMCEECNYIWESPQKYCGDPEESHCPKCGSAEIEETKPQNLPKADEYSLLAEVRADATLAIKLSKYVHDNCKDVPHDIGLKLEKIVSEHFS